MLTYLWIAIGSALGGMARYGMSRAVALRFGETFPWGTLTVNILGSLVIGFVAALSGPDSRVMISPGARQFIMVGLCGSFTTFSSFSLQTLELIRNRDFAEAGATSCCRSPRAWPRSRSVTLREAVWAISERCLNYLRPNSFSISEWPSFTQVGRPWLHWPQRGVDLHLAQQRVHFGDREHPPGPDGAVAGDGRGDMVELVLRLERLSSSASSSARSASRPCDVGLAERRRHGADQHRARAEALDLEAEVGKFGRAASSRSQSGSSSSTTSGSSSAWRATAATLAARAHPLEHQPLVRGMLVDDDQPVLGFGDDIGRRDLAAGDAEGKVGTGSTRGLGARRRARGRRERRASATSSSPPRKRGRASSDGSRLRGMSEIVVAALSSTSPAPPPARARRCAGSSSSSARRSPPTISPRTAAGSRKRTSVLAGWTLTSTSSSGTSTNRAAIGMAVARDQVAIGGAQGADQQPVLHRAAS